ncbi:MAG: MGMT family protein [Candidatus Omnitrophota bacterium]|jgi:O-6-methylguanine DNA methyltransferase
MTPFAKRVYRVILGIPLGEVRTYKWVARRAGNKNAYRAVGTILKNNPCPLIIPCHRVIKSNNILGRYRFGAKRKKAILDLERQIRKCLTTNA